MSAFRAQDPSFLSMVDATSCFFITLLLRNYLLIMEEYGQSSTIYCLFALWCYMLYDVICYVICYVMFWSVMSCHVVSCHVVISCHAISWGLSALLTPNALILQELQGNESHGIRVLTHCHNAGKATNTTTLCIIWGTPAVCKNHALWTTMFMPTNKAPLTVTYCTYTL